MCAIDWRIHLNSFSYAVVLSCPNIYSVRIAHFCCKIKKNKTRKQPFSFQTSGCIVLSAFYGTNGQNVYDPVPYPKLETCVNCELCWWTLISLWHWLQNDELSEASGVLRVICTFMKNDNWFVHLLSATDLYNTHWAVLCCVGSSMVLYSLHVHGEMCIHYWTLASNTCWLGKCSILAMKPFRHH